MTQREGLFARRGLIRPEAAAEMRQWEHGGGFSPDAAVRIEATDRKGLPTLRVLGAAGDPHPATTPAPSELTWDPGPVLREERDGIVEVVAMDHLCAGRAIGPYIVKIDVHGAEGKVLSGMTRVLQNDVRHLSCELQRDTPCFMAADLVAMLERPGL